MQHTVVGRNRRHHLLQYLSANHVGNGFGPRLWQKTEKIENKGLRAPCANLGLQVHKVHASTVAQVNRGIAAQKEGAPAARRNIEVC
jgi:hypothetical protein